MSFYGNHNLESVTCVVVVADCSSCVTKNCQVNNKSDDSCLTVSYNLKVFTSYLFTECEHLSRCLKLASLQSITLTLLLLSCRSPETIILLAKTKTIKSWDWSNTWTVKMPKSNKLVWYSRRPKETVVLIRWFVVKQTSTHGSELWINFCCVTYRDIWIVKHCTLVWLAPKKANYLVQYVCLVCTNVTMIITWLSCGQKGRFNYFHSFIGSIS